VSGILKGKGCVMHNNLTRVDCHPLESRGEIERLMPGSERGCRKSAARSLAGSLLYRTHGDNGGDGKTQFGCASCPYPLKSWGLLSDICGLFSPLSIGRAGASKTRRWITLISVDWLPPNLHPSDACLILGARVLFSLLTPPRVTPNWGCASSNGVGNLDSFGCNTHSYFIPQEARAPA
jgi:hypothetical protein